MRIILKKKFVIHEYYYIWYSNSKARIDNGFAILRNYTGDFFLESSIYWKKYIEYSSRNTRYIYHICG